ncbi:MAG: DUF2442 domain-containing protein [Acidimicrobiia bacterium]
MTQLPRITAVESLGDHRLRLTFDDGLVRDLDFRQVVDRGGVFEPLHDPEYFAQVTVDQVTGTICRPNGVDLDPDVLHGDAEPESGCGYELLREEHLRPTG